MVNGIGTIYPIELNNVPTDLKKPENMSITIVRIFEAIEIIRLHLRNLDKEMILSGRQHG